MNQLNSAQLLPSELNPRAAAAAHHAKQNLRYSISTTHQYCLPTSTPAGCEWTPTETQIFLIITNDPTPLREIWNRCKHLKNATFFDAQHPEQLEP